MVYKSKAKKSNTLAARSSQQKDFASPLYETIDANTAYIKKMLASPDDLVIRQCSIGQTEQKCGIVFMSNLADNEMIQDQIVRQIQQCSEFAQEQSKLTGDALLAALYEHMVPISETKISEHIDHSISQLLAGDTVLFIDGAKKAIVMSTMKYIGRLVDEPVTEALIRGPRDGFAENIVINTSLIRQRVRDPNLRIKTYKLGRRTQRKMVMVYIEGVVNPELVKEATRRIETIDLDGAMDSGYIEQWIEDSFLSPFPQILSTERPDKVSFALLQGQISILMDGSPFALIFPINLINALQSPEDYYERWLIGSLLRILRFTAAFLTVFLPAGYIALVAYHPGMLPSKLAFSLAATREGVPFPALVEALLMETTMELLREAGVRLPKPIGQTIGIVGGLVIGEAAVAAGIVSPVMVIIVAITAIASFSLPYYGLAISFRLLRFATMFAAAIFGLYGIILIFIMIAIHITNLKSFGIPYTSPLAPASFQDWKDTLIRAPITMLTKRPKFLHPIDLNRISIKDNDNESKSN